MKDIATIEQALMLLVFMDQLFLESVHYSLKIKPNPKFNKYYFTIQIMN
jgi:hypothetical protein